MRYIILALLLACTACAGPTRWPAVAAQATGRAHRIGQANSVWVVKLVAQGTIEERILALQERKAALAENMYSGSVGRKQPLFSEADLAELLKPLST